MIHLAEFLKLLGRILKYRHLFIDRQHGLCLTCFGSGLLGGVTRDRPSVRLDEHVFDEIFLLSLVPLLRIFNFYSIETANTDNLVSFLLRIEDRASAATS